MKHDQTAAVVHFVASWVFVLFACISSGSGLAQFAWYSSSDGLLWPWTGASLVQVGAFLFLATADSAQLTLRVRVAQLLAHLLALCITANDITVWCSALLFLVSVSVPLSVAAKHSELNMHDAVRNADIRSFFLCCRCCLIVCGAECTTRSAANWVSLVLHVCDLAQSRILRLLGRIIVSVSG